MSFFGHDQITAFSWLYRPTHHVTEIQWQWSIKTVVVKSSQNFRFQSCLLLTDFNSYWYVLLCVYNTLAAYYRISSSIFLNFASTVSYFCLASSAAKTAKHNTPDRSQKHNGQGKWRQDWKIRDANINSSPLHSVSTTLQQFENVLCTNIAAGLLLLLL